MKTYKAYLLGIGKSQATTNSNFKDICKYLNWLETESLDIEQTNYGDLLGYIAYIRKEKLSVASIQRALGSIKHYYNWQIKMGKMAGNPARHIKIQGTKTTKLYQIIDMKDLERIYAEWPEGGNEHQSIVKQRDKVLYGMLIWQGMSSKHIEAIRIQDIDLRKAMINIAGSRSSNERSISLEPQQIIDLLEYINHLRPKLLDVNKRKTDKLFISHGSGTHTANLLSRLRKQLSDNYPQITSLRQIRTSVITYWLKKYNLRQVQYMAGHRYVSSTEAYLVNDIENLQSDVDRFHPL